MFSGYRTLIGTPGAMKFSIPGVIARMPISMDSLALIFIVVAVSDSYALAGALSATASAVMALATPHWSRVADRIGQSAMLVRVIPIKVIGLSLFTVLVLNQTPVWTWFVSIILAESMSVNTGGLVRRRWLHILSPDKTSTAEDEQDRHLINTAYSFEALMDEIVFILGPIIVTACATTIAPAAGIISGIIFVMIGFPLFVMQKITEPPASPKRTVDPHPAVIGIKRVQAVVLSTTLLGGFFGSIAIVTVAFAQHRGQEGMSGILLAIWAFGSGIAAIINGTIKWKLSNASRFLMFLLALTLLSIPMLFAHSIVWLAVALFFNGFAVAPLVINAYGVAEGAVPAEQITETLTWVVAGMPMGGAISSALSGQVIDRFGADIAFWVPLGFMIAACAATLPYFRTYKALIGYPRARD
ncbi:MAG: MFS transporter [Actinomycetes bacterium]